MDVQTLIDRLLQQSPLVIMLVLVLIGGYKRWWVWGYQLATCEKDRDFWQQDDLKQRDLAASALKVADEMVEVTKELQRERQDTARTNIGRTRRIELDDGSER